MKIALRGAAVAAVGSGVLALASPASAGITVEVLNLSGAISDGTIDNPGYVHTVTVDADPGLQVINFQWVLVFEAFAPSWGSEARIQITAPDLTTYTFSGEDAGWGDSSGFFFDEGNTDAFNGVQLAGDWTFTFYESFDDAGISPDGIYNASLFVITAIPAPGALALLGLAGLAMPRRRRA